MTNATFQNITALIVDDDSAILECIEERLESMGHKCHRAQCQTDAESILEQHAFDYILLDLEIPNRFQGRADIEYGHNLLRKIRSTPGHSRTPVIAITAHGLKSHHLCAETMKLGATDYLGKPFGKDDPLENRIREALRNQENSANGAAAVPAASPAIKAFEGGDLVFYGDRVELCGVKVCGSKNSSLKRKILDLLTEKNAKGDYRNFAMKKIADQLSLERPGAVAEAVADFRRECRDRLQAQADIRCEDEDIISNQNAGYHFREWITVLEGLDAVEEAAARMNFALSENQKGIIRLLNKHTKRTPRQLADGLDVRTPIITAEVESLRKAGLVISEGNAASRVIRISPTIELKK